MTCLARSSSRDLVASRWALVLWGLPLALIVIGVLVSGARTALWVPAFSAMGLACLVNARVCGRFHCHVTGPLFLLAAAITLLDGIAIIAFASSWTLLIASVGTALAFAIEYGRRNRCQGSPAR